MTYLKQSIFSLIVGLALATTASAYQQAEEQDDTESSINLDESAIDQSIFGLVKHKGGGKWELPEWIKKAAEKQKKQREEQFQPYWDDFDDDFDDE